MANLGNLVKVTEAQYEELIEDGSSGTHEYDVNNIYLVDTDKALTVTNSQSTRVIPTITSAGVQENLTIGNGLTVSNGKLKASSAGKHFSYKITLAANLTGYWNFLLIKDDGTDEAVSFNFSASSSSSRTVTIDKDNVVAYKLVSKSMPNYSTTSYSARTGYIQYFNNSTLAVQQINNSDFLTLGVGSARVVLTDINVVVSLS